MTLRGPRVAAKPYPVVRHNGEVFLEVWLSADDCDAIALAMGETDSWSQELSLAAAYLREIGRDRWECPKCGTWSSATDILVCPECDACSRCGQPWSAHPRTTDGLSAATPTDCPDGVA